MAPSDRMISKVTQSGQIQAGEGQARAAIRRGAEWFLANQNDRFIHYGYDPASARWSDESHSVREMASLWSITEAARFLGDASLAALGQRGFAHFERFFRRDPRRDFLLVAINPKRIKISYSAFALLSLLNLEHERKGYYLERLAEGMLNRQLSSGRLATHFYSERLSGMDYYPGQALLALMALHEATGEERFLNAVARAFPHYRAYWRRHANTAFAPWQIQAFAKLLRQRPDPALAAFVFDMADFLLDAMRDSSGAGFDFSRGIVTAVYLEGVNRAYEALDRSGGFDDPARRERYADFIRQGCAAVMALQCPAAGEDASAPPGPALGGFYGSAEDRSFRCDRNQHAILGLMGASALGLID